MDAKDKIAIVILAMMSVLGFVLLLYGSTQPANIPLFSRYNQDYLGTTNIFTVMGFVLFIAGLTFLLIWVFTIPRKSKQQTQANEK